MKNTASHRRSQDASKKRRQTKRLAHAQSAVPAAHKRSKIGTLRLQNVEQLKTGVSLKTMRHSQSGSWVGLRGEDEFQDLPDDVETLVNEHGWELVEWNGRYVIITSLPSASSHKPTHCSGVKLLTDEEGLVFVVLAGKPKDPDWKAVCDSATLALSETAQIGLETGAFTLDDLKHRRGCSFFALPVGTSYGGGQEVCAMNYTLS